MYNRVRTQFWTKNSRTFQGYIFHFARTPCTAKSISIMIVFTCFLLLCCYVSARSIYFHIRHSMLDEISYKFQGLSSTDCNFQGLSRPWIFILKFKDFQGACEPWYNEAINAPNVTCITHDPTRGCFSTCDTQKTIVLVGFCCTLVFLEKQSMAFHN